MRGSTHKIGGLSAGIITLSLINSMNFQSILIASTAGIVGSLIPDIDEPNSIVGKKVKLLSKGFKTIFGHRGIIHTPFLLFLIYIGLNYCLRFITSEYIDVAKLAIWCFVSGYISHLVLDMFTPQGIMLLYPLSSYRFKIIGFKGEYRDLVFTCLCLISLILFLGWRYNLISFNTVELHNLIVNLKR